MKDGKTNLERAGDGQPPIDASGNAIELHHMNNDPKAPLVEGSKSTHARRHVKDRARAAEIKKQIRKDIEERKGENPGEAAPEAVSKEELVTARKQIQQYCWRQNKSDPRPGLRERVAERLGLGPEADAAELNQIVEQAVKRSDFDRRDRGKKWDQERKAYWKWRAGKLSETETKDQVDWLGGKSE